MFKIYPINEFGKQTIISLFNIKEEIDFNPYYQRHGGLWSRAKQILLIDTIINKFDIPKFYLNYFIEPTNPLNINDKKYAIIDGKQRLKAIFDFLEDKLKLDETCKFLEEPTINLKGLKYSDLKHHYPVLASRIENYILDIVYVVTDEEDKLEEMFLRLNGGVSLTNAEKRNAIGGYLNETIRKIVNVHKFFTDKVRFKNTRFQHNDLLLKLIYIESKGELINLSNRDLENFIRENKEKNNKVEIDIGETIKVLDKMNDIFQDKDTLLRGKGIIPVYYFFVRNKFTNSVEIKLFFQEFEKIRIENRKLEQPNSILQEFDYFNQQGVHKEKSLKFRFNVLSKYFEIFIKNNNKLDLTMKPNIEDNIDEFLEE